MKLRRRKFEFEVSGFGRKGTYLARNFASAVCQHRRECNVSGNPKKLRQFHCPHTEGGGFAGVQVELLNPLSGDRQPLISAGPAVVPISKPRLPNPWRWAATNQGVVRNGIVQPICNAVPRRQWNEYRKQMRERLAAQAQ